MIWSPPQSTHLLCYCAACAISLFSPVCCLSSVWRLIKCFALFYFTDATTDFWPYDQSCFASAKKWVPIPLHVENVSRVLKKCTHMSVCILKCAVARLHTPQYIIHYTLETEELLAAGISQTSFGTAPGTSHKTESIASLENPFAVSLQKTHWHWCFFVSHLCHAVVQQLRPHRKLRHYSKKQMVKIKSGKTS